jgi:hypothetical protein
MLPTPHRRKRPVRMTNLLSRSNHIPVQRFPLKIANHILPAREVCKAVAGSLLKLKDTFQVARITYITRVSPSIPIEFNLYMSDQAQHFSRLCLKPATAEAFSALTSARSGQRLAFLQGHPISRTADMSPADTCGIGDTRCATGCSQTCLLSARRRTSESRLPGKKKSVGRCKNVAYAMVTRDGCCATTCKLDVLAVRKSSGPSGRKRKRSLCRVKSMPR